jgi:hypothetical protein
MLWEILAKKLLAKGAFTDVKKTTKKFTWRYIHALSAWCSLCKLTKINILCTLI